MLQIIKPPFILNHLSGISLGHTSNLISLYTNLPTHKGLPVIFKVQSTNTYPHTIIKHKADNTFHTNLDICHYLSKYLVNSAENTVSLTSQSIPFQWYGQIYP